MSLATDFVPELIEGSDTGKTLEAMLDERRIRLTNPPAKPAFILKLAGHGLTTAGNIAVLSAQAKAGKSASIGAMLAAFFDDDGDADCLGFSAEPANGKAVLLFDTEQSLFDAWQLVHRSMSRAGRSTLPDNLRAYALLDLSASERLDLLHAELARASSECGGVHCALIDGVADLLENVNDIPAAIGLVQELRNFSVQYDCPIVCVLHENPAQPGFSGKTRGHLGSELERKADANLSIKKDSDNISVIFSNGKCRHAEISEHFAPRFKFCEKSMMHVSCEAASVAKAEANLEEMREEAREIFDTPDAITGLSWRDLHKRIEGIHKIKRSGARKRFGKLIKAGLIKKNAAGLYTR
jgi:hypothetical protein